MSQLRVSYVDLALQHRPIKTKILSAVEKVLDHGCFILGPEVEEFEERIADYCGSRYAVGVGSGTGALFLVLRTLGIGAGDEVITAPNSFVASASCIALAGATPVFVDVRDDYNMNPNLIEDAITSRTKAIIPVHLTGRPADINPIVQTAQRYGLHVVEDCAQAIGARYHGRHVGTFGEAGCFSFHPLKNLNAIGDGGAIVTDDADLCQKLRKARNLGLRNRDECESWSHNCRLDTIQAAILLIKMDYLDKCTEIRRDNAAFYREQLRCVVRVPEVKPYEYAVYHTFVVQADRRDDLQHYLLAHGVETRTHYPFPIHLQEAARNLGYKTNSFPVAERQAQRILSLPVHQDLPEVHLQYVVTKIKDFYGTSARARPSYTGQKDLPAIQLPPADDRQSAFSTRASPFV